jgi:peptidyl-Lys metalloendopeptidase
LTTELVNTGDETLKILNDPRTILRQHPTNTFAIFHDQSATSPAFAGVKVKYTHEAAVKYGKEDAYTILAPGASVSFNHDRESCFYFPRPADANFL